MERDGRHGRYSRRTSEHFNSHAHVERDGLIDEIAGSKNVISTHTLTWSVTKIVRVNNLIKHHFNSHAHVERDMP